MSNMTRAGSDTLSELVYQQIKTDIFDFKLMPGERFTESEIALTYQVSRTPTRQALYRLQQEGYVEVAFRSGWTVRPLNLQYYDELYELRIMIEQYAVRRLCTLDFSSSKEMKQLYKIWMVKPEQYRSSLKAMAQIDEDFHCTLVRAVGNREMTKMHQEISEKIRIIRRLDFSKSKRIELTYQEHQAILKDIAHKQAEAALEKITLHIQQSRDEVKKITLGMLSEHAVLKTTR